MNIEHPIYDFRTKEKRFSMRNLRVRFTKWYIKRGYEFGYHMTHFLDYDYASYATDLYGMCGKVESYFKCPWWVKPLLVFFSPSVYTVEAQGKCFVKGFEEGLKKRVESLYPHIFHFDEAQAVADQERFKKLINERFGGKE